MYSLFPSLIGRVGGWFFISLFVIACSSDTEDYDPYHDWQSRNAIWFNQVVDSARTAIDAAKGSYGDQWEEHCDWRMLKTFTKSPDFRNDVSTDYVCAKILHRGSGTVFPLYNDSVRINFRGWLMPTQKANGEMEELVFSQTYYQDYNADTALPQLAAVSNFKAGFATALQYMVQGDDWMVYIPQQLFYGSSIQGVIPAYSSVRFRIQLMGVYPLGTSVPDWK
ncbi:MAG: FKBP-type peptidyl-prolyl cis-trans isomerase [Bacteroidaceae bacterium]|nr:FKBP-type peptidyl-prolyl cis-trans isomerase [Bacteroidaceae bacterium]